MGYDTKFSGELTITPPLNEDERCEYAVLFSGDQRAKDKDGVEWSPSFHCHWVVTCAGSRLQYNDDSDGGFYGYVDWLTGIADRFMAPRGHRLNGQFTYQGEEIGDTGIITVADNVVTVTTMEDLLALQHLMADEPDLSSVVEKPRPAHASSPLFARWDKEHASEGPYAYFAGFEHDANAYSERLNLIIDDLEIYDRIELFSFVVDLLNEDSGDDKEVARGVDAVRHGGEG
jgi:hypothetical protein